MNGCIRAAWIRYGGACWVESIINNSNFRMQIKGLEQIPSEAVMPDKRHPIDAEFVVDVIYVPLVRLKRDYDPTNSLDATSMQYANVVLMANHHNQDDDRWDDCKEYHHR